MKFFKYLIFIFLLFSANAKADWYIELLGQDFGVFPSADSACKANRDRLSSSFTYKLEGSNCKLFNGGSLFGRYQLIETASQCSAQYIYSKPINVPGWTNWNLDQITAYSNKIQGQTACYKGCKYKNPSMTGDTTSDSMKLMFGDGVKDSSCPATSTEAPDTPYPDNVTPPADGCKNGEAYCDKPSTGCPSGYTSGSFNGKQICVKNSTDPTKPNPNDPNNNPNNSKFDDSRIIAAINDSKTAITNSINNAVNSINSSISSINQSITAVANAVNETTNAVNNNTNAVNAVKSSVDALHNTINAVTTAVNNNTSAVTSAVNANTTATNAVKASVDALHNTINAVTTAVDNNTKAVNANADKVSNSVKENTTATNAVKTAVDNLNTAVNAVSNAVNANGKNTVDAVNANGKNTVDAVNANGKNTVDAVNANGKNTVDAVNANGDKVTNAVNTNGKNTVDAVNKGTEATKENGKKLDGIKDGVDKGNGILGEIKDWLFADVDQSSFEAKTPMRDLEQKDIESDKYKVSGQCPVSKTFSFKGHTFTLDLSNFCYVLDIMGLIIGIAACLHGVAILSENT